MTTQFLEILVLHPERSMAATIRSVLALPDVHVTFTESVDAAAIEIERQAPDVFIVDWLGDDVIYGPESPGRDYVRRWLSDPSHPRSRRVIALTNGTPSIEILDFFSTHKIAHLAKPFYPTELVAMIEYLYA